MATEPSTARATASFARGGRKDDGAGTHASVTTRRRRKGSSDPRELAPGDTFAGYVIQEHLGEGGFANVFKAHDPRLERVVALKILTRQRRQTDQFVERFLREAQATARVMSPHLVVLFDSGEYEGRLYMAFEYLSGGDLSQLVNSQGPLPLREAVFYVGQCCAALQDLYDSGLTHRDVKPSNIFIDKHGNVKLGDLGLAQAISQEPGKPITRGGAVLGTPSYMSPEQAMGSANVDIRSDIFSLGTCFFCLLVGRPPFIGDNPYVVASSLINDPVPDLCALRPDLPVEVVQIVMRMLAKQPEDRYVDPGELMEDLIRLGGTDFRPRTAMHRRTLGLRAASEQGGSSTSLRRVSESMLPDGIESSRRRSSLELPAFTGDAPQRRRLPWAWVILLLIAVPSLLWLAVSAAPEPRTRGPEQASFPADPGGDQWPDDQGSTGEALPPQGTELGRPPPPPVPFPAAGLSVELANGSTLRSGADQHGPWLDILLGAGEPMLRFRRVAPTVFRMGPPDRPGPEVRLSRPFWIQDSEFSQAAWVAFGWDNPSIFVDPARPVEQVSWHEANAFAAHVAATLAPLRLRLPSEAEWEAAARLADRPEATPAAGHGVGERTRPVASSAADARGVHDLLGNVAEWCLDAYAPLALGPLQDPVATSGQLRVQRGGGWRHEASARRPWSRAAGPPAQRRGDVGFRLLLEDVGVMDLLRGPR